MRHNDSTESLDNFENGDQASKMAKEGLINLEKSKFFDDIQFIAAFHTNGWYYTAKDGRLWLQKDGYLSF
jgi:hypothetical protein